MLQKKSSTSSCEYQDLVSDKTIHPYDRTTSYPTYLGFQESKSCMGINLSTEGLKSRSTALNGSSDSVIRGITTPFSFSNMDQNGLNHFQIIIESIQSKVTRDPDRLK